jgi:GntR family transcriptional regulator/MocR family aminotransferase
METPSPNNISAPKLNQLFITPSPYHANEHGRECGNLKYPLPMQFVIPLSRDGEPLSRQIYLWMRKAALSGTLPAGERLPSSRELAEQLAVSRTVVIMAYEQLLAEGFVIGRHGSGTYIAEGLGSRREHSEERRSTPIILSPYGSYAASAIPKINVPRPRAKHLRHDFSYRSSPLEGFPLAAWQRTLGRRARRAPTETHEYGSAEGKLGLREAIAFHLRRSRAVVCDPSQIVVVNGSQQAIDLAARVLLKPGDRVVIENPHYQGAREIFRAAGARLHPVRVDEDGLVIDLLPPQARVAFVTPSHQFPTGAILPLARRLGLLAWAKRAGAVIIEDDYDGEFRYEGQPVESMQGLDTEGRVVYVGTFSRTIFPSLRIGYLIAPKSLVPAFIGAKWLADRHTSTLEQETLAEFIASGAYERYLRRARKANASRRDVLLKAIDEFLGDRVTVTGHGSGAHIVLWPRRYTSEETAIARAADVGVGIYGTSHYFYSRPRRTGLLLGYAHMRKEDVREGIRRLATVL